jgi:hypothetical protein
MMRRVAATVLCALAFAAPAAAQSRAARLEISAGALFAGGHELATTTAELIPNQQGGGAHPVFSADIRAEAAPGFEARVGWRLTRRFVIEGGVFTSRPRLRARLTGDIENAPDVTIEEDFSLYIIDAAVLVNFGSELSRVVPFVRAGGGYLRELHEENVLVETGQAYHFGGGVTAWLGQRPHRIGVRADARVYVLSGGIDLGTSTRTMAAGGGAVVFTF